MGDVQVQNIPECSEGDQLCEVRNFEPEVIVVPALLFSVSCLVAGFLFWLTCRHRRDEKPPSDRGDVSKPPSLSPRPPAPRIDPATDPVLRGWSLRRENVVGGLRWVASGRYGQIYRARLAEGAEGGRERPVVVKELQASASAALSEEFLARIRFQAELGPHPNLVAMLGCCLDDGPPSYILEDLELGPLLNFLWLCRKDMVTVESTPYDLTEKQVYDIALDIASALEFLHRKGLSHGGVGARNVLLRNDLSARLCSLRHPFLARRPGDERDGVTCPPRKWQSPQQLMRGLADNKTDVWSFGILLYEIITLGSPPYGDLSPNNILQYLQRGKRMAKPATCRTSLYKVMTLCWQWQEELRPDMPAVRRRLGKGRQTANDRAVLRVPHRIDPEAYALVAGISDQARAQDYTVF